mmetsp:Transcript_21753/g.24948  ORF Transcript_21753/g.24948 Transcript_21753/m.24948 type:complete len:274 (+) Transcript_21753:1-822(+)
MMFVGAMCYIYLWALKRGTRSRTKSKVAPRNKSISQILPLGIARAADIGFGNAALSLITVALQQIIKSTIPVHVCILNVTILKKKISPRVWAALVPIILGAALASWGPGASTPVGWGVLMATISCLARAAKAIINERLLQAPLSEDRLGTIEIISMESPISGSFLLVIGIFFEYHQVKEWLDSTTRSDDEVVPSVGFLLFYNSCCGLCMLLNQWSYISIIKYTSSVTCQVLMNLKMIALIAVSVTIFGTAVRAIQVVGILIAALGCTWYALVK